MGRGQLLNSIPDLQIEWASQHATRSIRDFAISVKGLTERQYRHIIAHAPAREWNTRRGEIQNTISVSKIERLTREAVEIQHGFIEAAKLGLVRATRFMAKATNDADNGGLSPEALVSCLKALQATQEVFLRAMGVKKDEGLIQVFDSLKRQSKVPCKEQTENPLSDLPYEDIMMLIEVKRDQRAESRIQNESF